MSVRASLIAIDRPTTQHSIHRVDTGISSFLKELEMCIITDDITKKQCSSPQRMKVLSTYKRISLWLIPPEPVLTSLTQTQLQLIDFHDSRSNNMPFLDNGEKKKRLPKFVPHITLVGGIPISECCCTEEDNVMPFIPPQNNIEKQDSSSDIDEVAAQNVLRRLACAFDNFGGVDCTFVKERGVFAARRRTNDDDDDEGEVQWNQSCISIMERTHTFTKAMELAEQTLFTKQSSSGATVENECGQQQPSAILHASSLERHFKPPACEPHYSFVYGNDADLISSLHSSSVDTDQSSDSGTNKVVLECPPNFTSTEIAVVWTYPSSLEGVRQWREIGRFSLVESKSKY